MQVGTPELSCRDCVGAEIFLRCHLVGTARNRWSFEFVLVDVAPKEPARNAGGVGWWSDGVLE
jgi:hypothetical protein